MAEVDGTNKKGIQLKQSPRGILQKQHSEIFGKTHRNIPVQEYCVGVKLY